MSTMVAKIGLSSIYRSKDNALYRVDSSSKVNSYIVSTPASREIVNNPEICSTEFQEKFSSALQTGVEMFRAYQDDELINGLKTHPIDVLYILRGGLNFNLHRVLELALRKHIEVSFISSQRTADEGGFTINEDAYNKWSLQDKSILCLGDISATGTTIIHALKNIFSQYKKQNNQCKGVIFFTIGTFQTIDALERTLQQLALIQGSDQISISIIYLEAIFELYQYNDYLSDNHLPYTDFFHSTYPRSVELEASLLNSPTALIERCAIYDGGSRAFEPKTYLANLLKYWESFYKKHYTIRDLIQRKTDFLDYELPFQQWRSKRDWWSDIDESELQNLYNKGKTVLETLLQMNITELVKARIEQIQYSKRQEGKLILQVIDKLAYVKIVDRKVLITRSRGVIDIFYIPGGKREKDETDHQALIREVKEELDIELVIDSLEYIGTFEAQAHGKPEGVIVRMTCYTGNYHGEIKPTSEIEEIDWFTYKDRERISPVDKVIFDWLKEQGKID